MRNFKRLQLLAVAALSACLVQTANAQTPATAPATIATAGAPAALDRTPAYSQFRCDENYAYLKEPGASTDYMDPIKYIPLGPAGNSDDFYLSLGGQFRERYEYYNNYLLGNSVQDEDGYYLTRALLHADLHLSKYVRVFAQGITAIEDDRINGPRAGSDVDQIDVMQLFVDLNIPWNDSDTSTFRFGRQVLSYGAQRLISAKDWSNDRRAFDGFKFINEYKGENFSNTLEAFVVRPVLIREEPNEAEGFDNGDRSQTLWGIYDTTLLPNIIEKANTKVEVYFITLDQTATANPVRTYDADTYSVGSHVSTNPKPFDADVEGTYQFGTRDTQDISAFSFSTELGTTAEGLPFTPRGFVGFDYASGDGSRTDGTYTTFNQLFPAGHKYFGEVDLIGRQNIVSPNAGFELTFLKNQSYAKKLSARAQYLAFFRANDNDSVYLASGNPLTRPTASSDSFIGQEVDVALFWQVDRHLAFTASYCHFFAGDYVHSSSGGNNNIARDVDFAYFIASFTF